MGAKTDQGLECNPVAFPVVGIGASAGGLLALEGFFRALPPDPGMAFVVVQHLSPDFKSLMGELLARFTPLPSHRVEQGMCIAPNAIFLIPAGMNMTLSHGRFVLSARDKAGPIHHPINVFFESLAREIGPQAYGVILSGTGTDGSVGVRHIQAGGGVVLVQTPESADFDGMPRAATSETEPACIDTPENLARFLFGLPRIPSAAGAVNGKEGDGQKLEGTSAPDIPGHERIFAHIGALSGLDFGQYKIATVSRRLDRRMSLKKFSDVEAYVAYLQKDPDEWSALYRDLLIGVTHFFRDPEAFEILGRDVLPALFLEKDPQDEVRIWVAGCATGEEAYSLAIQCEEVAQRMARRPRVRVFATDVHRAAIDFASHGIYTDDQMLGVSAERRACYFEETTLGWRVLPTIRRMVVFAEHNLLADAPFTRMDLVSCRNLLIYLRPEAQTRVLDGLYFALRRGGTLFLGPSEGLGLLEGTLEPIDRHWDLYTKVHEGPPPRGLQHRPPTRQTRGHTPYLRQDLLSSKNRLDRSLRLMIEHLAPSGFLITRQRELLYTFGDAGRYLSPRGPATEDFLALLPAELRTGVGSAIQRVLQRGAAVQFDRVRIEADPSVYHRISVEPLETGSRSDSLLFVRLERSEAVQAEAPAPELLSRDDAIASHIVELERELQEARDNLQSTVEELESTNEELQAANEEMLAANEELQSTNEELQSVNEELFIVNAEYEHKNEALIEANDDLNNLIECTDIGTVFLDKQLCIRKFTPSISSTFNLRTQDVGRPLMDIAPLLLVDGSNLVEDIRAVLESGLTREREVFNTLGTALLQRIHPYRDEFGRVQGAALTYVDLHLVKSAEAKIIAAEQFLGAVLNSISANVAVLNAEGTIIATNGAWLDFATANAADNLATVEVGANYFGACICAAEDAAFLDAQKAISGIKGVLHGRLPYFEMEYPCHGPHEERWFVMRVTPLNVPEGGAVVTHINVTSFKRMQEAIASQEQKYRSLYQNTPVGLYRCTLDGMLVDFNDHMLDITGHPSREVFARLFDPLAFGRVESPDRFEDRLRAEGWLENFETTLDRSDGRRLWLNINATPVAESGLDRLVFDVSVSDISVQKTVQVELLAAQSESKQLIAAVHAAAESILITDVQGRIVFVNPAFTEVTGYTASEVLGGTPAILKSDKQSSSFYEDLWGTILSGKSWSGQFINRRKSGELYTVRGTIAQVLSAEGRITQFVGVMRDCTEQEALERQVRQTQKLEAIGTLAGGIAHDFNNILAAIQGYTDLALESIPEDSDARHDLTQVLEASQRAADLVRQILTFSRPTEKAQRAVELRLIVDEALKLLRASLPSNIEIRSEVARDGAKVMADPTQLHQVLMNLCTNAHHAMREVGGLLEVRLESATVEAAAAATLSVAPGEYLVLQVRDSGSGMDAGTLERIFEPFFSTKGLEGNGMGLSIVHGVVKSCGGAIHAESTPGKGSAFTIYLPRVAHAAEADELVARDAQFAAGSERILVVDDEPGLASLLCRVLTQNGFQPTGLSDSREALRLVLENPGRFDMVVTDQTMPGMLGVELAQAIWASAPNLPIVLTSGFSENITPEEVLQLGFAAYLPKPVGLPRLTREIRRVLDTCSGTAPT